MFVCPNCNIKIDQHAPFCPSCQADFDKQSAWRPVDPSAPKRTEPYIPNVISGWNRFWYTLYCVVLIAYSAYSLYAGSFYMPGVRGRGVSLRGLPSVVMCMAALCGVACLISMIADHYDERDNEEVYQLFAMRAKYTGWGLFILAFGMSMGRG